MEVRGETDFSDQPSILVKEGEEENVLSGDILSLLPKTNDDKVIYRADPPIQILRWPLEPGKEWINFYTVTYRQFEGTSKGEINMVVSRREQIKVAAGTFETALIEVYDAGSLRAEYWYSPRAKWIVKIRFYDPRGVLTEDELVSFRVD
jgi:hypothetical protein